MVLAAWDTSNLVVFENAAGKACVTCCDGNPPPEPGFEPGLCCPGFGASSTPSAYTAEIIGIQDCPVAGATVLNGVWILSLLECEEIPFPEEPSCGWKYEDSNVIIQFTRSHVGGGCASLSFVANWKDGDDVRAGFNDLKSFTQATGLCADFTNDFVNCTAPKFGRFGTVKVWPLDWLQWVIVTTYFVGDRVFNDGEIYECIISHVADATNEPGVGVDWMTYWQVGDPCGDPNVVCP